MCVGGHGEGGCLSPLSVMGLDTARCVPPALDSARCLHGDGGPFPFHDAQNRLLVGDADALFLAGQRARHVGYDVQHSRKAARGGVNVPQGTKWRPPLRTRRRRHTPDEPSLLGAEVREGWWPSSSMAGACAATGTCVGSNLEVGAQCRMGLYGGSSAVPILCLGVSPVGGQSVARCVCRQSGVTEW